MMQGVGISSWYRSLPKPAALTCAILAVGCNLQWGSTVASVASRGVDAQILAAPVVDAALIDV